MKFNPTDEEGLEGFAARMDAKLIIIGMPYLDDNEVVNGMRVDYLLRSMPNWISTKIREKESPCHHEQWCFARAVNDVRRILAARPTEGRREPTHRQEKKNNSDRSSSSNNWRIDRKESKKPEAKNSSPRFKKLSDEDYKKHRDENKCFQCHQAGHISRDCPRKSSKRDKDKPAHLGALFMIIEGNHTLKVQLKKPQAKLPVKAHEQDAGYDVFTAEDAIIKAGTRMLIDTGIAIETPEGTYCRIAPRSSLALKGIDVKAGVVDQGFTGTIKVLLANDNKKGEYRIRTGDKIAQLIFEVIKNDMWVEQTNIIKETDRNDQGFGSTDEKKEIPPPKKSKVATYTGYRYGADNNHKLYSKGDTYEDAEKQEDRNKKRCFKCHKEGYLA